MCGMQYILPLPILYGSRCLHNIKPVFLLRPFFRSRDQDRDLEKMNSSALESRDHGLEITTPYKTSSLFVAVGDVG